MSALAHSADRFRRAFADHAARQPAAAPAWRVAQRRAAIERLTERGFPGRKNEDWKYTDLTDWAARPLWPTAISAAVQPAALAEYRLDAWQLVFVDGRFMPSLSDLDGLPDGVRIGSLADRLARDPAALKDRLGRSVDADRHGFAALNLAFAEDGAVIEIARDLDLQRPVQLLWAASGAPEQVQHLRHLVILEAGARASLIECGISLADAPGLATAVTEIELGAGAGLQHYRLLREPDRLTHIETCHVRQQRDSRYASHRITLGGRQLRQEIDCVLEAEGAECLLNDLTLARGAAHVDTHIRIDHCAPHTTSRQWSRAVVEDEARSIFSGRVVVHPGAQRSDAVQHNRNLLLSPRAEADSRPQLEIYADDVKCAHGAATGSLDPESLFYLRSRGLDARHARQLLVYAFAAEVLARLPHEPLRHHVAGLMGQRLLPGAALEELTR